MQTGRFGKGWRPSAAHKVGLGHPQLTQVVVPDAADVPMPPVVDQGQTSSCTGNSSAVAIQQAMSKGSNKWAELPSRLFLYFGARDLEGGSQFDEGAQIADIFEAASVVGVPPESAWTFSEDIQKITATPDWKAVRAAADQRIVEGAWRILSTGQQRVQDVRLALASECSVVWGTDLDQPFEDMGPTGVWPGVTREVIGGHAMILCSYRTNAAGRVEFKTQSSWGSSWCDGGRCWIDEAAVASPHASDFWIVSLVSTYSG